MVSVDEENALVVKPYVVTKDLTDRADQSPSRYAVDFDDMSLEAAEEFRLPMDHVRQVVLPRRETLREKKPRVAENWWQYEARQPSMRKAVRELPRVLLGPQTAKYWFVTWVANGWVYSHMVTVFAFEDDRHAAVLSSTFHDAWARKYSGSLETRLRYSPTDCFQNFPFPEDVSVLDAIGDGYLTYRKETLLAENQGLTKVYNRVHEQPDDTFERIEELRRLRRELDRAVADAYGWTDLELDHDFRETPLGLRYTISDPVKTEALDRLLELNHARYAEEVAQGLHAKSTKGARKARPRKSETPASESLFEA
jgi:hypothetical protein